MREAINLEFYKLIAKYQENPEVVRNTLKALIEDVEERLPTINNLVRECHKTSKSKGFQLNDHIKQLLLIATEVDEALDEVTAEMEHILLRSVRTKFQNLMKEFESIRKKEYLFEDSKIVDPFHLAEELADICIRVFSYAGANNIDLTYAIQDKIRKNKERPEKHGKAF